MLLIFYIIFFYFLLNLAALYITEKPDQMMQGPVSGAVLCIREIGDPYVILNSFPCGKKSRPLSIIVHKDTVSPPVQQDTLSLTRIIQTFPVLPAEEFRLNWPPVCLSGREFLVVSFHEFG